METSTANEFVSTLQRLNELFNAQSRTLEQELRQSQAVVVDQRNLIASLEAKVATLDARVADAESAQAALVSERATLLEENVQLANALQRTKAELSKLVHFKQAILHTFDESENGPVTGVYSPGVPQATPRSSAASFAAAQPPLSSSISAALGVADKYSAMAASELAQAGTGIHSGLSSSNNPAASFRSASAAPQPQSADDLIAEINRSLNSPPRPAPSSPSPSSFGSPAHIDTKKDGTEFFRAARARLPYEAFNAFLESIKALNDGVQSRDETLQKAWETFGPSGEDLYAQFKALISKHGSL